jgi:hypothetical protein
MSDLTKEKAIQLSYELWSWMKENNEVSKDGWPGWKDHGRMMYDCPCCEYEISQREDRYCDRACVKNCPLINIWAAKRESCCPPCCRKNSPFQRFEEFEGYDNEREKMVEIVSNMEAAIKKEMERLKIERIK